MKHAFLCREVMLSGAFSRNQSSYSEDNFLAAEEIPSPNLAIGVRKESMLHRGDLLRSIRHIKNEVKLNFQENSESKSK